MSHSPNHFKIMELRKVSMLRTLEAIMVIFASLLAIAILPSILLRYLYAGQQLFEQPKLLEYIPIIAFAIATFYFFRALLGNMKREKDIKNIMTEIQLGNDDCCGKCDKDACGNDDDAEKDEDWDEDLQELEELLAEVDEEEKTQKKKSTSKKSKAKKAKK